MLTTTAAGAGATPTAKAGACAADAPGTQTEHKLEPATAAGVILPEAGQFLLLCSLQLWQLLQHCRQALASVQVVFMHFISVLWKQFSANDTFLREVNGYKRALVLINERQVTLHPSEAAKRVSFGIAEAGGTSSTSNNNSSSSSCSNVIV